MLPPPFFFYSFYGVPMTTSSEVFQPLLETFEEPLKRGKPFPYVLFGRYGEVEYHTTNEKGADVWEKKVVPELIVFDVSDNHANEAKIRRLARQGLRILKWEMPQSIGDSLESQKTPYPELAQICEEISRAQQGLEALAVQKTGAFDVKVAEAKKRNGKES